jgi:hypothetical protein
MVWWQTGQFGTRIAARQQLQRVDLDRHAMAAVGRHPVEARRERADAPRRRRPAQRAQGEIGPLVRTRRVLAVDRDMRDAQVGIAVGRARIDGEELDGGVVGGRVLLAFARLERSRRGDERHPRLGQRLAQRLERDLRVVRPFIGRAIAQGLIVGAGPLDIADRRLMGGSEAEVAAKIGHAALL